MKMVSCCAAAVLLLAVPAAAVTQAPIPLGADNLEFQFAPGTCRDGVNLGHIGGSVVTYTYRGCSSKDILTIDFVYNDQPDAMALFGVFQAGSEETIGRKTIAIVDAWWTKGKTSRGEGIYYQQVWPRGTSGTTGYVMVVPEPGSWALLIAGFALVGAALRRRHRAAA